MLIEILLIIAFFLLVTEAFVSAMGVFGFAGFAAYVAGTWMLIESDTNAFYGLPISVIIGIGVVYAIALAILIYTLRKNRQKRIETGVESLVGQTGTVTYWDASSGKIFIDGEDWRAEGPAGLEKDDTVVVTDYKHLTLIVKKDA